MTRSIIVFILSFIVAPFSFASDRLTVKHHQIDIRVAISLVADFCGRSVVLGPSIQGVTSLDFDDVPCSQAFDLLLESNHLLSSLAGDVLVITAMDHVLDSERKADDLRTFRRDLFNSNDIERRIINIIHASAADVVSLFKESFMSLDAPQMSMTVDERTNSVFAALPSSFFPALESVIQSIDVPVRQVAIEANVVEASVDWSKRLGLNWGGALSLGNWSAVTAGDLSVAAGSSIGFGFLSNTFSLDTIFSAMETDGEGRVVSRPTLLTLDRQSASVLRGTELPYQQSAGDGATSVSFKHAALSLEVKPIISPDNSIVIEVLVSRDSPDFSNAIDGVPPINTNRLVTTIRVPHGQTVVLGGVYSDIDHKGSSRVSGFSRIPVIGRLFKKKEHVTEQSELLIFLTPRILGLELASDKQVLTFDDPDFLGDLF